MHNTSPLTGTPCPVFAALLLEASRQRQLLFRTYRVEKHYAVSSGKWYFEFEVMTAGPMRVGWAKADCAPGSMLGSDESTWAFDGYNVSISIWRVVG